MAHKIDISIGNICKKHLFPITFAGDIRRRYLSPITFDERLISCDIIAPSLLNRIQLGKGSSLLYLDSALGRLDIYGVLHSTTNSITITSNALPTSSVGYASLQDGLALSSSAQESAVSYVQKDDAKVSMLMRSAVSILIGRYRLLSEMDQSSLSLFDADALNTVDFINY